MSEPPEIAEILEWDSRFFGKTIGRVLLPKLNPFLAARIDDWAKSNKVDCIYFLAASNDPVTCVTAENFGYHLTDIRVTLIHQENHEPGHLDHATNIRKAEERDIEALRHISRGNHLDSRFYYDGHFDPAKCDELYEIWIEKSVRGASDYVLVWDEADKPVGYVTAKVLSNRGGSIDLVGVDPKYQGRGIGFQLTNSLLDWFQSNNVSPVTVVTQGRNIKAQTLYQRCGFITHSVELWFHKWFG